jgi:hypothetical protein
MSPGPSLCSYKRAFKDDLGSPLQSGGRTFWHRENCGFPSETFLLAKTSTGRQKVYQILNYLHHFQDGHQEARIIHPYDIPEKPWESISVDYMSGLSSTKHRNGCVFVVIDRFSKMAILTTCKNTITATDTAKLFFERVWVHFGIP